MINISQLILLAQRIKDNTAVAHFEWVTTESHLSKKMNELKLSQFPLLVVVTPSYNVDAQNSDNVKDISQMLFFVLKRNQYQGANPASEAADADQTLAIVQQIKTFLLNGFPNVRDCIFPSAMEPNSINIDPEWNYLGCDGWSLSFQIKGEWLMPPQIESHTLRWSSRKCVKQQTENLLLWERPVCVTADPAIELAWTEPQCVKLLKENILSWSEKVCVTDFFFIHTAQINSQPLPETDLDPYQVGFTIGFYPNDIQGNAVGLQAWHKYNDGAWQYNPATPDAWGAGYVYFWQSPVNQPNQPWPAGNISFKFRIQKSIDGTTYSDEVILENALTIIHLP